jgi:hypothetical protein
MKEDLQSRSRSLNSINAQLSQNLTPEHIDRVVDYYVQPQNLILLFRLHKGYASDYDPQDFVEEVGFSGLTGFQVDFKHPDPTIASSLYGSQRVEGVFQFRNMRWKMTELHVPLHYVPSYIPDNRSTASK